MSYTRLLYHIVFRTKCSAPSISGEHAEKLYAYIWGTVKNKKSVLYRIGGMPEHIHLLIDLHPALSLADFVHDLKITSGNYLRDHHDLFPVFDGWGESYAAFSYGLSEKEAVIHYIKNQAEHHKTISFADEFRKFILENGGSIDERYFLHD